MRYFSEKTLRSMRRAVVSPEASAMRISIICAA
jgi:hypothetical protein